MSNDDPIFIGGLSGSGKTQLRVVLGANPALSLTRRTGMWTRFYGRFGDLHDEASLDRCVHTMVADRRVQLLQPDEAHIRREFAAGPCSYARLIGLFHEHHAQRNGKRRWGDQLSFVECFADPIFAAFPSARMLHMVRDPRARSDAAAGSARRGKIGWDTAMWLHSARLAQRNRHRYAGRYRVVRYEHLAARPVETIEAVCAFLGEPFTGAMHDELGSVRFDVDERAMAGRPASFVETYTRAELAYLGYADASPPLPGSRLGYWLGDWPFDRTAMAAWRTVRRRRLQRQVTT
jgi:sulfotransferase family protein